MNGFVKYVLVAVTALSAFVVRRTGSSPPTPYRLSYPSYFGNRTNFADDNPLTVEGVALGRYLFYEKRLSSSDDISCASYHQQSRAFTDGRAFSPGFDGVPTKRNSMSLANLLWVRNFFWDGRAGSLEAQAVVPLTDPHEMGQSLDSAVRKLGAIGFYDSLFTAAFGLGDGGGAGVIRPDRIVKALGKIEGTL